MPVLAVPVVAAFLDVRLAVVALVVPNFIVNVTQFRRYLPHNEEPGFAVKFALSGMLGAMLGSWALAILPGYFLSLGMTVIIVAYVCLRLLKPAFQIPMPVAQRLVWPAGFGGGILQGTVGISAPIAVTFANAIRLPRPVFIATISIFFATMCLVQFPMLIGLGLMNWTVVLLGVLSLPPLFAGIALGERIGGMLDAKRFDQIILLLLAVLAVIQIVGML